MRRTRSLTTAAGTALLFLLLALGGCASLVGVVRGTTDAGGPANPTLAPVTSQFSLADKAVTRLDPAWTMEFDRPVVAAMAAGEGLVLLGRSYGSVRNSTNWSAIAYAPDGRKLWEQSFTAERYRTIEVEVVGPAPLFVVSAFDYAKTGDLYVYSSAGELLWTREVSSSASIKADAAGLRVVGIDRGDKALFIVEAATGHEIASVAVSREAALQVAPTGDILISDPASALRVNPVGKVVARVENNLRYVAVGLDPAGDALFAATGGSDCAIYRFGATGELAWRTKLPVGGSNNLVVGDDGRYVVAFDVGLGHDLVLLDAATGATLATTTMAAVPGAFSQYIKWVRFLPGDAGLLVDLVVARNPGGVRSEEHSLLWLSAQGAYMARTSLGANADVSTTADGKMAMVVTTRPLDQQSPAIGQVKFFDLEPLYQRQ